MWRNAKEIDDQKVAELCLALNREDPGPRPVPESHIRRTLAALRADPVRGKVLVLDYKGAVRGYAILISFWSNELGGEICTLDEFYVDAELRSRGLGRSLLENLIQGNGQWEGKPVAFDLEVTPENSRARSFYEKLGFRAAKNVHMRLRF